MFAFRRDGAHVEEIAGLLGLASTGGSTSFEGATLSSSQEPYLAECRGWVIGSNVMNWDWLLTDGDYLDGLAARLTLGTILFFLMEGTSDTYCIGVARDGQVVRMVVRSQGEVVVDAGAKSGDGHTLPFSAEALANTEDPEGYVLSVLTAEVASFDTLARLTFAAYRLADES